MEFSELLRRRRMVHHYTDERVPREVLGRIAATVRRAPSAGFSQGQRLLVVDDPALLAELGQDESAGAEPWFGSAAAHIVVLTREQDYHDRYQRQDKLQDGDEIVWPVPFWFVDGVTLGHGAPDPDWSKRTSRATERRRTLDELVHWNRW